MIENILSGLMLKDAMKAGAISAQRIGSGYHNEFPEQFFFYKITLANGDSYLAASTAGDPIYEADDPEAFREWADACGVDLDGEQE